MNFIEAELANSFGNRIIHVPMNEPDNEMIEINIEFKFNKIFCSEIELVYDNEILKNTLEALCAAFEAISQKTHKDIVFFRPQIIFKPYPEITIIGRIKLRKKVEVKMDKKIKSAKKVMDKKMDSLVKADVKRDKKCDMAEMKAKKKK